MKAKIIVPFSILFAFAWLLVSASHALGCEPDEDNPFRCLQVSKPTPAPVVLAIAAHTVPSFGTNPDNAAEPTGAWVSIAPYETHWFKVNDAGMELRIWIDANGQGRADLAMAIFAPEQKDLYGKPIGRGSFNPSLPTHDLFWEGATRANGVWHVQVNNRTNVPMTYRIDYKRVINSVRAGCSLCHGATIDDWSRCQDNGTNWCEQLQDSYGK